MLDISAQSAIISTVLKSEDFAGSEKAFNGAELSDGICESAGTGRQARLRGVCQPTWEFKSPLSHHISTMVLIRNYRAFSMSESPCSIRVNCILEQ